MTKTKQTKKQKQNTVVEPTHKNPEVLKDLYQKQKMSAGQIAKMCGVSRAAVLFQMRKHDIPITTRKAKSPDAKEDYKNKTWLTAQLNCFVSAKFRPLRIFLKRWFAYNKSTQGDIDEYQEEVIACLHRNLS